MTMLIKTATILLAIIGWRFIAHELGIPNSIAFVAGCAGSWAVWVMLPIQRSQP